MRRICSRTLLKQLTRQVFVPELRPNIAYAICRTARFQFDRQLGDTRILQISRFLLLRVIPRGSEEASSMSDRPLRAPPTPPRYLPLASERAHALKSSNTPVADWSSRLPARCSLLHLARLTSCISRLTVSGAC